jgi:hypothetical protein
LRKLGWAWLTSLSWSRIEHKPKHQTQGTVPAYGCAPTESDLVQDIGTQKIQRYKWFIDGAVEKGSFSLFFHKLILFCSVAMQYTAALALAIFLYYTE